MIYRLLRLMIYNRAGTRIGRFTWVWWTGFGLLLVADNKDFLSDQAAMWLYLLWLPTAFLNHFDRSGPTIGEFQEAERTRAEKEARYLARRESTVAHRLGRWVGRLRGQREAARRGRPPKA